MFFYYVIMDKDTLNTLEGILDKKLGSLNTKIDGLHAGMEETKNSIKFISEQYDEILGRLKTIEEEKKELIKENESLREELTATTTALNRLKEDHNNLEQYSRRDCLEIRGIPISEDENTNESVVKLANKIGVKMAYQDISTCHRLPRRSDPQALPAIIVKFVRRDMRDQLYRARKRLRNMTSKDLGYRNNNRVYINESLTQSNKNLLSKCLKLKRDSKFKFLWTISGKIMLRQREDSRVFCIQSEKDLNKLIDDLDAT